MKRFKVFGQNIGYTRSPEIHNFIYAHMGIEAEYGVMDVPQEQFKDSLESLFALDGFNVTKPYKRRIADFVEVQGEFDAINTVVCRGGVRKGYNTDAYGFETHLNKVVDPKGCHVLVLGAGGVAEVAVPILRAKGAEVFVYNRTRSRAESLCARHDASVVSDKRGRYEIVLNCTPYGQLAGENAGADIDFSGTVLAYDMLYRKTDFLKAAESAGVPFVENGLAMLIYQAIRADELFLDRTFDDKEGLFCQIYEKMNQEGER